ncbi:hypothetical protein TWF694_011581 [Orbilia ellipsospora]|uniref:Protein kinase domain-containing protein n=1 Tax=Orbilia ellipsospora TaxID=2528407 RepID=A0AAV9X6S0_9PEZI
MFSAKPKRISHESYTVAWICALPLEMAVAKAMLDHTHSPLPQHPSDQNSYTLGEIAGRNVVIACLPSGRYGVSSAAIVATQLLFTYTSVRFGLMVGIGGGVPSQANDIRLGDIVVSRPTGTQGGVVQYDLGKIMTGGKFERTGDLNKPPQVLLTAISSLQADGYMGLDRVPELLSEMTAKYPAMAAKFTHRGQGEDLLFKSTYDHVGSNPKCDECHIDELEVRRERPTSVPVIHYGLIASSSQVMKDAKTRDKLAAELGIICFEMEAAGLMDNFPCIVIRGICDYSDSHKNKQWQEYAAATAAAYAKWLVSVTSFSQISETPTVLQATSRSPIPYPHSPPISPEVRPARPVPKPSAGDYSSGGQPSVVQSVRQTLSGQAGSSNPLDKALDNFFIPTRAQYNDDDFGSIARLLNASGSKYKQMPRLYTLLRHLDRLRDLDYFLTKGFSDQSLPFGQTQLPSKFSEGWKTRFLAAQELVCGSSDVVQMMAKGKHMTFTKTPEYFISERIIATGERSRVDKILCILGAEYYARKQFYRRIMTAEDAQAMQSFKNEMDIMKTVVHHHCVKLVASYTDRNVFAFIMLPIAQYNLAKYLREEMACDPDDKRSFLLSFIGCLSRTFWFIHRQKLRHRDIKPENILVHNNRVVVTDFDCSYSWAHTNRSTTVKAPPLTWKYASPEVARSGLQETNRINSSSDIWSLGCVFLEIITVLKGQSLQELETYLHGNHYYACQSEIYMWIDHLRSQEPKGSANLVLDWIQQMLQENPEERPKAHQLVEVTCSAPNPMDFCCEDCLREDHQSLETSNTTTNATNITENMSGISISEGLAKSLQPRPGSSQKVETFNEVESYLTNLTSSSNDTVSSTNTEASGYSTPMSVMSGTSMSASFSNAAKLRSPVAAPSGSSINTFNRDNYLAEVCTVMNKTKDSLNWDELSVVMASYTVYKKGMLAAGFIERN